MAVPLTVEERRALLAEHVSQLVLMGHKIEAEGLTSTTLTHGRLLPRHELASVDEAGEFSLQAFRPRRADVFRLVAIGLAAAFVLLLIAIRLWLSFS